MAAKIPIVGRPFTEAGFAAYVAALVLGVWKPRFVVLHNTAVPRLDEWHKSSGPARMSSLAQYYASKGWHAGPHLFIADDSIWVFSDLRQPGVHSPSWNKVAWGVEMVGDFASEPFDSGAGAMVRDNAVAAVAVLSMKAGLDSSSMRLHKEDKRTDHDCPGRYVIKADVIKRVHDEIVRRRAESA